MPQDQDRLPQPTAQRVAPALRGLIEPIDALQADPANVRLHDERNLDAIAGSLYYIPTDRGYEKMIAGRLKQWRTLKEKTKK